MTERESRKEISNWTLTQSIQTKHRSNRNESFSGYYQCYMITYRKKTTKVQWKAQFGLYVQSEPNAYSQWSFSVNELFWPHAGQLRSHVGSLIRWITEKWSETKKMKNVLVPWFVKAPSVKWNRFVCAHALWTLPSECFPWCVAKLSWSMEMSSWRATQNSTYGRTVTP